MTISYGPWPSDVFLLFFGWVPPGNPHEAVVLFDGLADLAAFYLDQLAGAPGSSEAERGDERSSAAAEAALAALEGQLGPAKGYERLVATAEGLDGRLVQALRALHAAEGGPAVAEVLAARCASLLAGYATSAEQDAQLLVAPVGAAPEAALRFRASKKELLSLVQRSLLRG